MSDDCEDYRTNRADHFIADNANTIAPQLTKKRSTRFHEHRSARLTENPIESSERRTKIRRHDNT
ncbi:hypothetical protein [Mesorhizobium helmanticense]|uniref:hypothetical protein n=1 Tax=Mesorhizobium helmanticense TaxID=1776423 RepID=UPI0011B22109|nr:hypothetical protein [Mesorhizobium helmanticense]